MSNEKARVDCANSPAGKDQTPTSQEENQTMSILTDSEAVHQAIREWAADYAAELRAHMAAAATSAEYSAFAQTFPDSIVSTPPYLSALWAEGQVQGIETAAQALPIWPAWVTAVEVGMMTSGVVMITAAGVEHGDGDVTARVNGIVNVVVLPELSELEGDPGTRTEVGDHDLGSSLEVEWDGAEPNDGSSAERVGRLGLALLQASTQLAAIEAGVH